MSAIFTTLGQLAQQGAESRDIATERKQQAEKFQLDKQEALQRLATQKSANLKILPPGQFKAGNGKMYARYLDPNGNIITKELEGESPEDPATAYLRSRKILTGSGLTDEQADSILGTKSSMSSAVVKGDVIPDENSPTKFSIPYRDKATGRELWREPGNPKSSQTDTVSDYFIPVTDKDGNIYLEPTQRITKRVPQGGASQNPQVPQSSQSSQGTTGQSSQPNPTIQSLARGGRRVIGHKPMSEADRRAMGDLQIAYAAIPRLSKILEDNNLQNDNNLIGQYVNWGQYVAGLRISDDARQQIMNYVGWLGTSLPALYSQGRMSQYLFEQASGHLPRPNMTPARLYENIKWLEENVLPQMREAIDSPIGDWKIPDKYNIIQSQNDIQVNAIIKALNKKKK